MCPTAGWWSGSARGEAPPVGLQPACRTSPAGPRTDTALELLPALLAGELVRLVDEPGQPDLQLAPAVPRPPFWVGNASGAAIRRAARLAELAASYGRAVPTVTVRAAGALGAGTDVRDHIAAELTEAYGIPAEQAAGIPLTGPPAEVAARLRAYQDAGAAHVVVGFVDGDWRRQCDQLAQARAQLR